MARFGYNPEQRLEHGSPFDLSEGERKLHTLLVPSHKNQAIALEEFSDLYDPAQIKKDEELVQKLERIFENSRDHSNKDETRKAKHDIERGELFEAIIADQIELSDWFGPDATFIVPSRFDDIENGIDGIIEFEKEDSLSHLALAIDATTSTIHIREKLQRVKDSIDKESLSLVRYFKSKNMRGELTKVPRIVLGVQKKSFDSLANALVEYKILQKNKVDNPQQHEKFKKFRDELSTHEVSFTILHEAITELRAFSAYAQKTEKQDIAVIYNRMLAILEGILKTRTKGKNAGDIEEVSENDTIYREIQLLLSEIFGP